MLGKTYRSSLFHTYQKKQDVHTGVQFHDRNSDLSAPKNRSKDLFLPQPSLQDCSFQMQCLLLSKLLQGHFIKNRKIILTYVFQIIFLQHVYFLHFIECLLKFNLENISIKTQEKQEQSRSSSRMLLFPSQIYFSQQCLNTYLLGLPSVSEQILNDKSTSTFHFP